MTCPHVMSMQVSIRLSNITRSYKNYMYSHHLLYRNNECVYIKLIGWLMINRLPP